jgi:hypothetical protein
MLEKPRYIKRIWNDVIPIGMIKHKPNHISFVDISNSANVIEIVGKDGHHVCSDLTREKESLEKQSNANHNGNCDQSYCALIGSINSLEEKDEG